MEKLHISFENFKDKMDTIKIVVVDRLIRSNRPDCSQTIREWEEYLFTDEEKNYI